jgi:hypothetical protein
MPRCSIVLPAKWLLLRESDFCSCSRPEIYMNISVSTVERRLAQKLITNKRDRLLPCSALRGKPQKKETVNPVLLDLPF